MVLKDPLAAKDSLIPSALNLIMKVNHRSGPWYSVVNVLGIFM